MNKEEIALFAKLTEQVDNLRKDVHEMRKKSLEDGERRVVSTLEDRLRGICSRGNLNFAAEHASMLKFSDTRAKEEFLNFLEARGGQFSSTHPANQIAAKFLEARDASVLEKFSKKPAHIREVLVEAEQDYYRAINSPNESEAKQFSAMWPDCETWLGYIAEMEEEKSGNYHRQMRAV